MVIKRNFDIRNLVRELSENKVAGKLDRRAKPVLSPPIDTHEITYDDGGKTRTIPVLELSALFPQAAGRKRRG